MRFIITVDFWKKAAIQIANNDPFPDQVVMIQRKGLWYLNDFQLSEHSDQLKFHFVNLASISELENRPLSQNQLCVFIDIKQYLFYYRLEQNGQWITKNIVKLDLKELISPIEVLKTTGKNNLTLMKYRFLPNINLDQLYQTKCLIIGTGTIGCNLARCLLSWGIEWMTFIDNGTVSHSNLLRQNLFEFTDLGRSKAVAAAERVKRIYPPTENKVTGYHYQIPMPDHPDSMEDLTSRVNFLERQIENHDIVFLGTDNKESRWLPTVLAIIKNRPLINLALGFDNWVVMRHPLNVTQNKTKKMETITPISRKVWSQSGTIKSASQPVLSVNHLPKTVKILDRLPIEQFGCYFCTSVEGIVNTVKDRQIDEKCTVTRGCCSTIASAYGVELLIALLNHTDGFYVSAENNCQSSLLPLSSNYIPQQLRGSIRQLDIKQCLVRRNPQCCACSQKILDYVTDPLTRIRFLEGVCQDSRVLKKITNLDQFEITSSYDNLLEIDDL